MPLASTLFVPGASDSITTTEGAIAAYTWAVVIGVALGVGDGAADRGRRVGEPPQSATTAIRTSASTPAAAT